VAPESLPIDENLPAIVDALHRSPCLVIVAPPGAGKTTRVPPALIRSGLIPRSLVMLQPRRVAARAAARRIADENGWPLGGDVGYQVRFEKVMTETTRIRILTEGILTRRIQSDPFLDGIDAVLLDEFHLRSLDGDLGLAMVREIQRSLRGDLKIVVMSATLEAGPVAEFLGGCPVITSEGKLFPVAMSYEERRSEKPVVERAARAAAACLVAGGGDAGGGDAADDAGGHVLVFLPGAGEIRRCREKLTRLTDAPVLPLHGGLSAADQDRAVRPGPERSVILATNVAETSLTIDGVTAVIDTGLVRLNSHDPDTGIDRLETRMISADSAKQRAGRAGRTGPGRVIRLWTKGVQKGLLPRTPPEILRVDLCRTILELHSWGSDPERFGWFEKPDTAALSTACRLLTGLGALDEEGKVTPLGRTLTRLPLHPRLGRLLCAAHEKGFLHEGTALAALLSERDILRPRLFGRQGSAEGALPTGPSDLLLRLELLAGVGSRRLPDPEIDRAGTARVRKVCRELEKTAAAAFGAFRRRRPSEEDLLHLLFLAFPDRVARRRAKGDSRAVMVGGKGLRLSPKSSVRDAEFFVALDMDGSGADARVHLASAILPEWLDTTEETSHSFDATRQRVTALRRSLFRDLCVNEFPVPPDRLEAARILAGEAGRDVDRALEPSAGVRSFMVRITCLRDWMPDLDLPAMDKGTLAGLLPDLCRGARSFEELRRIDLLSRLKGTLTHHQLAALDRFAPEGITVPSGTSVRLDYEPGRPPILAVQIQRLFGLAETPHLAGGRVKVLLHLLAPNGRPAQITQDLASFWNSTYAQVRKDLRGRYPKHSWPEDPRKAKPESRPRRKGKGKG
jgi:ATP-dependent helicase HrpB